MIRWRPTPDEERWLELASRLGGDVPPAALAERTGGWRSTGPLARIALFALGLVAAALLVGILDVGHEATLLLAGLISALAAEWLSVRKRLHASGIEEGLSVAGFLMVGIWFALQVVPSVLDDPDFHVLVLIAAAGAAGVRRLNPFVTTCAVIALVTWVGTTAAAQALDRAMGAGTAAFFFGSALAAIALAGGARQYRRPSHDRMLDWLVAALPLAAYAQHAGWDMFDPQDVPSGIGSTRLATVLLLLGLGAALLATGLRRRRHAPLWGFIGCVAGLAIELGTMVPVARETWLIACGLVALVAGAALDRYLRRPRDGLTSETLARGEGIGDLLQIAGSALLAHRAAPQAEPPEAGYRGGGGKFGGGGASGEY